MQRRNFLKQTLLSSAGLLATPILSKAGWFTAGGTGISDAAEIEKYFVNVPDAARPWVFWQWMNGNITKEGITLDMEAMVRMGIGGAISFNAGTGIVRGPVDYASEAWMEANVHMAKEANRLGLDIAIHNSPGYSGCGGPWVTPEISMQQLVWTETLIKGGSTINTKLKKPFSKHNYYQDAFVIAYPALQPEKGLMKDYLASITFNGKPADKDILTDGNPETKIRLEVAAQNKGVVVLEFVKPFEARAITILRKAEIPHDLFDGPRDHPPVFQIDCSNDQKSWTPVGVLSMPALREMDTPGALSFPAVTAKYFRLTAASATWISNIEFHSGPRLAGWPGKMNYTGGNANGETPDLQPNELIDPAQVIDLSTRMNSAGELTWKAQKGNWTVLRIGHTTTGEEPAAHPDSGKGLEIDKLRKDALDFHFDAFLDQLLNRLKPYTGKGFKAITVDSWEAGKQNWTKEFPAAFKQLKKYEITSWMPALTGRIVGSLEDTERFLWDFRKTNADMLAENFYGHYHHKCRERGLEFYAEPYGDGTFDSLQSARHLDITMSEFWTRYIYGSDVTSKQASSAAHVYGKKIVAAEAFTAMPATSKWTDYPYSLKAEGDYFFTLGVNRLVFHTLVHQPYQTGMPGMTMGPFGMHMDRNNSWAEESYGWTNYLKRAQYLLQQGVFVADACYFKGDEPASGVPDIYQFMPPGHVGDVIGADAFNRFTIKDNLIILPDGMNYKVCIMAGLKAILPDTLSRIKALVKEGMILIVSSKPSKSFGHQCTDQEVQLAVAELYGDLDGKSVTENTYGKGKVWWKPLDEVFKILAIQPDFSYLSQNTDAVVHYIHKKMPEMEYYFVSNHRRRQETVACTFRISELQPEIWNAETGEIYTPGVFQSGNNFTVLTLTLPPAGSFFIVFRKKGKPAYTSVLKNDKAIMGFTTVLSDTTNNFSIMLWAKPDTFAHTGRSMLFHPAEGEKLFGTGHATVGVGAGQNGVFVYERTKGVQKQVLAVVKPLSGWTHLTLVYKDGKPSIWINGKLAAADEGSGMIIHPGLNTPAAVEQFSSYFEGNYTPPVLYKETLSAAAIYSIFEKGLPAPPLQDGIEIKHKDDQNRLLAWSNGKYTFKNGQEKSTSINITSCRSAVLSESWKLNFPASSGITSAIILPKLMSLRLHPDFDVKHFAGTVTYHTQFNITKADLVSEQKLFLDLGRVEVLATIKINGKTLGQVWKAPFQLEITDAVKLGSNELEIKVTTLWANRLIGDEYLPIENKYSEHGFIEKMPDWYTHNQPKPGQRKAFAVWKNFKSTDPLLESGLLGPVSLLTAIEMALKD